MSIGNVIWAKFDLNISQQNTEYFSINQTRVYLLSYYNTWTKLNNTKQNTYTQAMNCCNWEWLKYSTVLLFPHDFTRVDHQEENSSVFTLEMNTTRFSHFIEILFDTCF